MQKLQEFTCAARGLPHPTEFKWFLEDFGGGSTGNPLNIESRIQRTIRDGNEEVLEETVKVNLQSSEMVTKNLSCVAVQFDDEGNEVETRYNTHYPYTCAAWVLD